MSRRQDPGATITIYGAPLVAFLQSRVGDGGLATFILGNDDVFDRGYGIASRENASAAYRPMLSLVLAPIPEPSTHWLACAGVAFVLARLRPAVSGHGTGRRA